MRRTSELRREIKRMFVPAVTGKGFVLDQKNGPAFWDFRRETPNGVHVFEIQWDKYGRPRFIVNFGTCPLDGLVIDGRRFSPEEVLPGWLPEFGRLQPRKGASPASWFRQDKPLWWRLLSRTQLCPASEVVADLMRLFPEIEAYWSTGTTGPHLRVVRLRR